MFGAAAFCCSCGHVGNKQAQVKLPVASSQSVITGAHRQRESALTELELHQPGLQRGINLQSSAEFANISVIPTVRTQSCGSKHGRD